jgi:hypothetical protein
MMSRTISIPKPRRSFFAILRLDNMVYLKKGLGGGLELGKS